MADEGQRAQQLRAQALRQQAQAQRVQQAQGSVFRSIDDLVRSVAAGATFGTADELAAAASGLTGIGGQDPQAATFGERVAAERVRDEAINPATRLTGNIAGGVLTGLAATPAAMAGGVARAAPTIGQAVRTGAAAGALSGAATGAGEAEGGLAERTAGAVTGGLTGALTGAVAGPVTSGATRLANRIRQRIFQGSENRAREVALRKVAEGLEREELTEEMARARLRRLGEEGMLADIGIEGGALQGLARAAGGAQGRGRTLAQRNLLGRTRRQVRRVNNAIRSIVSGEDAAKVADDLLEDRTRIASVMYERAFRSQPAGGLQSDDVIALVGRPAVKDADGEIIEEAIKGNPTVRAAINRWRRIDPRAEGLPDNSLEALDQAYKFIGGRAQALRRTGDNVQAGSMNELRQQLRNAITDEVAEYGAALDTFSTRSQILDALDQGRRIFNQEPSEIRRILGEFDEPEREAFQIGLADALTDRLSRVAEQGDASKRLFGNQRLRDQVRAAFPDQQAFRNFTRAMVREARFSRTGRVATPTSGSRTAPSLLEEQDILERPIVQDVRTGVVFGPQAAAMSRGARIIEDVVNRFTAGPEDIRNQIARLLLTPGQGSANQAITDALRRQALAGALSRRAAAVGGVAGGAQAGRGAPANADFLLGF